MATKVFQGAHDPVPQGKTPHLGKTARDKASGVWKRYLQNQDEKRQENRTRRKR